MAGGASCPSGLGPAPRRQLVSLPSESTGDCRARVLLAKRRAGARTSLPVTLSASRQITWTSGRPGSCPPCSTWAGSSVSPSPPGPLPRTHARWPASLRRVPQGSTALSGRSPPASWALADGRLALRQTRCARTQDRRAGGVRALTGDGALGSAYSPTPGRPPLAHWEVPPGHSRVTTATEVCQARWRRLPANGDWEGPREGRPRLAAVAAISPSLWGLAGGQHLSPSPAPRIAGGILAGVVSDRLGKRASTCGLMLLLAAPTVSLPRPPTHPRMLPTPGRSPLPPPDPPWPSLPRPPPLAGLPPHRPPLTRQGPGALPASPAPGSAWLPRPRLSFLLENGDTGPAHTVSTSVRVRASPLSQGRRARRRHRPLPVRHAAGPRPSPERGPVFSRLGATGPPLPQVQLSRQTARGGDAETRSAGRGPSPVRLSGEPRAGSGPACLGRGRGACLPAAPGAPPVQPACRPGQRGLRRALELSPL